MPEEEEERPIFRVRPGRNRLVQLKPDVIPPITGFGELVAPNTLLVPNELANAPNQPLIGDVFDNVTIEFELDQPGGGGAGEVENDNNWGIGPKGLAATRFWDRGFRGQGVRIGIADSGLDARHPAFASLMAERRLHWVCALRQERGEAGATGGGRLTVGRHAGDADLLPLAWHALRRRARRPANRGQVSGHGSGRGAGGDPCVRASERRLSRGIAAGLSWLTEQACDVASLSLGWPGLHEEWAAPVQALLDAGVVVVAAVGNEFLAAGVPKSRSPANYLTTPRDAAAGMLIVVGAHDEDGNVWNRSGGEQVDWSQVEVEQTDGSTRPSIFTAVPARIVPALVAPGVNIISSNTGWAVLFFAGQLDGDPAYRRPARAGAVGSAHTRPGRAPAHRGGRFAGQPRGSAANRARHPFWRWPRGPRPAFGCDRAMTG